MCGILIHYRDFEPKYNLKHRGIIYRDMDYKNLILKHWSLPLQTYNTNLEQPLRINKDRVLLYNGEIFNYKDFGDYNNDVEYLLDFFSKRDWFKNKQIHEWDGFWSLVLIDKDCIYCFTDPLGKKQLYYSPKGISSEIKPLLNEYGLNHMLIPITIKGNYFKRIFRIKPNCIYMFKQNKGKWFDNVKYFLNNYYKFKKMNKKIDLYELINKSVVDRLINRMDNITLLISGGLDSTIILYHLYINRIKNIEYLTIENDEDVYIDSISSFFNIKIKKISLKNINIHRITKMIEHPYDYGSSIPQYFLFKNSKNRVVFTGDGADELFGGYSRSLLSDTQNYDIFTELPYLHHIRLDRLSMNFTKECRNPFLSKDIINYSLSLNYKDRIGKKILKTMYMNKIPSIILEREKKPLRYGNKNECLNKFTGSFRENFKHE